MAVSLPALPPLAAGATLGKVERSVSWWLGDWWAFGEARYGQRKALVEAEDWDGPSYQTCMDAAYVASQFELSRRRDSLSFNHHREVAALPAAEADALLSWAEKPARERADRAVKIEDAEISASGITQTEAVHLRPKSPDAEISASGISQAPGEQFLAKQLPRREFDELRKRLCSKCRCRRLWP